MDEQARVARFVDEHDLSCPPAYRLLDLSAEVGELAADATESSEYGTTPDALSVKEDELGDTLFALLALCEELDVDAGEALDTAIGKYEGRLTERGDAGSQ
ncbi:nucleotide pyrophosphohydrolase [Halosegnis rubeus]|jgi:NTP pyrophosphatase (non-canonical NTP hydrolase)|uniref:Nucleotide pyrophosphohydrolase n=1 Tax=Halosegnis rubeus TaxID=2212850 RepID=A0A5N5U3B7_9EURY|nr:MazG nucleotide pyrophosphohydrolase domain-containing protein [Halosegnis rubeus]KAB7512861.1 nucleotide pyrophosphohydrolase [Halosegnis rubeus]KAB7512977.1 nucleotide pyrophosphohydrolase [Halosegnis rubeus]